MNSLATIPFSLEAEAVFFEKSSADEGKKRRIAGIISTEARDRQQEIIIQKGLDFGPFLAHGWFNDNHSKATDGVVGYPESIEKFKRGQPLPNGDVAKSNCTWVEGYLLPEGYARADGIWDLGQALRKSGSGRGLGFSIEGNVQKRSGPGNRIIAKASIQNVAVTNMPVNPNTKLELLAKSLTTVLQTDDQVAKALTMGPGSQTSVAGVPLTGEGAGALLSPESLEQDSKKRKKLKKQVAISLLKKALPAWPDHYIGLLVDAAIQKGRRSA